MDDRAVRMIHLALAAGLAAVRLPSQGGVESFPVQHLEPITVRVLDGKTGTPLPHQRLRLAGGYDAKDIEQGLWPAEVRTDAAGEARVPRGLVDFPFLQVRVEKARLCQDRSRGESYNVGRIRGEGLSAPNSCGLAAVVEMPRMLVIFVKGNRSSAQPAVPAKDAGEPSPHGRNTAQEPGLDFAAGNSPGSPTELERLTPSTRNEIDSLERRAENVGPPVPPPDPGHPGTGDVDDAYDVLCQPET